ncbi:MAG: MFS transporter, partial [Pseudonocardia sp.]|nr:MFS transporter [Pseudonocardia sp.]
MTAILQPAGSLQKRLRPLHLTVFLQGVGFWVPVEKLFMSEIGFDAAGIGLMAGAYAAVVPLLEVPSGILADRWSRRGVLVVAGAALALSALVGGLSHDVPTYVLSALALGVFFAMSSGTIEAIVYDTVLEETGDSAEFERQMGRIRMVCSLALVTSALAGGLLAGVA